MQKNSEPLHCNHCSATSSFDMVKPIFGWICQLTSVSGMNCRNKVGIAARPPDQFAGSVAGLSEPWAPTLPLKCTAQPSDRSRHADRDQNIRADKLGAACPESGVVDTMIAISICRSRINPRHRHQA
jgi:hypothetical protein